MYQLRKHPLTGEVVSVRNLETDSSIPFDPDNTDYQQYLAWVAEGNTPQEADDAAN